MADDRRDGAAEMPLKGGADMVSTRNQRRLTVLFAVCVCLAALLLAVQILAVLLPWRMTKIDVGSDNISRVSEKSANLAAGLTEDVRVYWLCSGGETDYAMEMFLTRYTEAGKHISVEVIDTDTQTDFAEQYIGSSSTLSNYSLIVESDRRVSVLDYTDLYVFSNDVIDSLYGSVTYLTYSQLAQYMTYYSAYLQNSVTSRYFRGEAQLSGAIDYVTAESIPQGYILTGHGDTSLPELLLNVMGSYGLSTLDLAGTGEIPENADCLILYAPESDLTESEETQIRAFLSGGGSFLLATDPASLSACPRAAGLGSLYGLTAAEGIVSDAEESHHGADGATDLKPDCSTDNTVSATIGKNCTVTMPSSHAVTVADKLPLGVTVTPILTTSEQAVRLDSDGTTALCEAGVLNVGVCADLTVAQSDGSSRTGHFVWFGSTEAFTEAEAEENEYGNYSMMLGFFLYMSETYTSEYSSADFICLDGDSIEMESVTAILWGVVAVLLIPAACLTAGLCISARRRRYRTAVTR